MSGFRIRIRSDRKVRFVSRPNRFVVEASMEDEEDTIICHLHDPGRLKEILIPGNDLLIRYAARPGRKTDWEVIAGKVGRRWVLINSSYHRMISESILGNPLISPFGKPKEILPEVKVGNSRLDFKLLDRKNKEIYIEVKGCSLTLNGKAMFPDAPTERGRRHVEELIELKKKGYGAALMILVLGPEAECFCPKADTDPEFARIFYRSVDLGVEVYPLSFAFDGTHIHYNGRIPLCEHT
ncbi:MAG: DNA/RNA nuclease SfsA [Candidatus Thermoplasmatota archaeon]|nr:DNA/RNA nuclease SfsA [Candidatus Thermoplasmatota archaeon]